MDSLKKEYAVESPAYQGIMVKPHPLAFKYCVGNGVELGASFHNSFNLPNCLNIAPSNGVDYLHLRDREDYMHWVKEQEKYAGAGNVARVDKIGDFRKIPADTESLDFVISSHVIEHEPNPIAGFLEASRVLKTGGIFFCIFPKRTAEKSCDIFRPVTPLEELIQAYTEDRTVDKFYLEESSGASFHNWINRQKSVCLSFFSKLWFYTLPLCVLCKRDIRLKQKSFSGNACCWNRNAKIDGGNFSDYSANITLIRYVDGK